MTVAMLQNPKAMRTDWIRQYPTPTVNPPRIVQTPTYAYAAAGTAAAVLGLFVGIAIAAISGRVLSPLQSHDSASVKSNSAGLSAHLSAPPQQPPSFQAQVNKQDNTMFSSSMTAAVKTPASQESPAVHKQPVLRSVAVVTSGERSSATRMVSSTHEPFVSHIASVTATAALPPAPELAKVDDAPKPFTFMVEGDVTVADYNASARMIETNEGKTFVIAKTVGASNTLSWPDSSSNVHYRCDQSGNCTLFHAGIIVPNARLAI